MNLNTLDSFNLKGKKVLIRLDINSAVSNKKIMDSPRFLSSSQTVAELLKKKAIVAIIAHQGRKGDSDFCSLAQHAKILSRYTKSKISYVDSLFEPKALDAFNSLKPGQAIVMKNVREYDDEKDVNNTENRFIQFSSNFDYFVNDAFSVCHREAASIIIPPRYLPAIAGRGLEKELTALEKIKLNSKNCIFFIGGMKIEDYLPLFDLLKEKSNTVVASGVLANLFLLARGFRLSKEEAWLKDKGLFYLLPKIVELNNKYPKQIVIPIDGATGNKVRKEYPVEIFPENEKLWDIGEKTIELYKNDLKGKKVAFIKGPLGFTENPIFSKGTVEVLKEISALSKKKKIFSILGGGHLTTALEEYKIKDNFTYTSLSGGALIAYISGKKLPGLEAMQKSS